MNREIIERSLMSAPSDESIFENTKMTFGEHLDELRLALLKSVAALAIGFLIALIPSVAGSVVEYVQTPLKAALAEYTAGDSKQRSTDYYEAQRLAGEPVPADIEAAAEVMARGGLG